MKKKERTTVTFSQPKRGNRGGAGDRDKDNRGTGKRKARPEIRLAEGVTGNRANRECEPREVLSQELGSTGVISRNRGGNAGPSTHLVDCGARRELADHEEEEGRLEEKEDEDCSNVDPQGRQPKRRNSSNA